MTEETIPVWAQLAASMVGRGEYTLARDQICSAYFQKHIEWNDVLDFCVKCEMVRKDTGQELISKLVKIDFPHHKELQEEFTKILVELRI